jgi:hypothetical protein
VHRCFSFRCGGDFLKFEISENEMKWVSSKLMACVGSETSVELYRSCMIRTEKNQAHFIMQGFDGLVKIKATGVVSLKEEELIFVPVRQFVKAAKAFSEDGKVTFIARDGHIEFHASTKRAKLQLLKQHVDLEERFLEIDERFLEIDGDCKVACPELGHFLDMTSKFAADETKQNMCAVQCAEGSVVASDGVCMFHVNTPFVYKCNFSVSQAKRLSKLFCDETINAFQSQNDLVLESPTITWLGREPSGPFANCHQHIGKLISGFKYRAVLCGKTFCDAIAALTWDVEKSGSILFSLSGKTLGLSCKESASISKANLPVISGDFVDSEFVLDSKYLLLIASCLTAENLDLHYAVDGSVIGLSQGDVCAFLCRKRA